MMKNKTDKVVDEIIGTGSGLINPNSDDFKALRKSIQERAKKMSNEERMQLQIKGLTYRMESYFENKTPETLIPVGAFLKELVEVIGVAHKDFATYIGYKNTNLSALYKGTRRINHDLALKLGSIFNMNPALWLNLQNKIELLQIRGQSDQEYQQYRLNDLLKKAG